MKTFLKSMWILVTVVLCVGLMAAGVNGIFNHVTSTTGYQVAGSAGSSGDALCSDGTNYDTPCAVGAFYQTIELATVPETQRPVLNFGPWFTVTDSSSPARTTINLNAPGSNDVVATYGSSPGSSTAAAVFDGNGNLVPSSAPSPGTRHNCFSSSGCSGGGPYVSGTTYTNSLSVPVTEEVGMTTSSGSPCTGADASITFIVAGIAGYGNGVWNQCNGIAGVTFTVPAGATFSATVNYIDGGTTPVLSSWAETVN